jgi:hypothetical protein
MHEAIDILEAAIPTTDPAEVYAVTHKALASAIKVIARADDSSGSSVVPAVACWSSIIPRSLRQHRVPAGDLVDWMIKFQFDGDVDNFTIDPVAYVPALGTSGTATYRARLSHSLRLSPLGGFHQLAQHVRLRIPAK